MNGIVARINYLLTSAMCLLGPLQTGFGKPWRNVHDYEIHSVELLA